MPNYLGELIKELRGTMSLREFGKKCDVSHTHIDSIEKGVDPRTGKTVNVTVEMLSKIAKATRTELPYLVALSTGTSPEEFEMKKKENRGVSIPVYGRIAAGIPIEAVEDILDYEEITPEMAATGDYIALQIKGDSMASRISDGDVVIIRIQPDVDSGDIAAVFVNGDSVTLKKIKKESNGIWLIAFNPAYQPVFYSSEDCARLPIRFLGKMVELRAKF